MIHVALNTMTRTRTHGSGWGGRRGWEGTRIANVIFVRFFQRVPYRTISCRFAKEWRETRTHRAGQKKKFQKSFWPTETRSTRHRFSLFVSFVCWLLSFFFLENNGASASLCRLDHLWERKHAKRVWRKRDGALETTSVGVASTPRPPAPALWRRELNLKKEKKTNKKRNRSSSES